MDALWFASIGNPCDSAEIQQRELRKGGYSPFLPNTSHLHSKQNAILVPEFQQPVFKDGDS